MKYRLMFTKQAVKDAQRLKEAGLTENARELLDILKSNPLENPPPFHKLTGDLAGVYSRRINYQHRLVYEILAAEKTVKIIRMWTHYE